jgi:hypothetical protein
MGLGLPSLVWWPHRLLPDAALHMGADATAVGTSPSCVESTQIQARIAVRNPSVSSLPISDAGCVPVTLMNKTLTLLLARQCTAISVGKKRSCESRGTKCAQSGSTPLGDKEGSAW